MVCLHYRGKQGKEAQPNQHDNGSQVFFLGVMFSKKSEKNSKLGFFHENGIFCHVVIYSRFSYLWDWCACFTGIPIQ